MSSVATALADLDEDAQGRVIRWAAERYVVALGKQGGRHGGAGGGGAVSDETDDDVTEEEIAAEAPSYEHFAELFAAAAEDERGQGARSRLLGAGDPGAGTVGLAAVEC